jgi:RNA recognition motif-containing protein
MSVRLYVGNLPEELDRQELASVFSEAGDSVSTKVITDRKTGKCRGFGFVTVKTPELADQLIEKFNGYVFKENTLKIEKALPRAKGKAEDENSDSDTEEIEATHNTEKPARRKNNNNNQKSKRSAAPGRVTAEPEANQPDPRWAQELEKLKQLLAAQATNP